jgi:hypothetical protein
VVGVVTPLSKVKVNVFAVGPSKNALDAIGIKYEPVLMFVPFRTQVGAQAASLGMTPKVFEVDPAFAILKVDVDGKLELIAQELMICTPQEQVAESYPSEITTDAVPLPTYETFGVNTAAEVFEPEETLKKVGLMGDPFHCQA